MSMNLCVGAECVVTLPNGKEHKIIESFELYQTPTSVTRDLLCKVEKFKAYEKHCKGFTFNVIDEDGWNYVEEHIDELKRWLKDMEDKGFIINWYGM